MRRSRYGDRFLIAYYGNEHGGRSLDQPLGTVTTRDRFAVIDGDRMRMLSIEEYRIAMGFPAAYWLIPTPEALIPGGPCRTWMSSRRSPSVPLLAD